MTEQEHSGGPKYLLAAGCAVRIEASAGLGGTKVYLDGVEVKALKEVRFIHRANNVAVLQLEIYPSAVDLCGDVTALSTTVSFLDELHTLLTHALQGWSEEDAAAADRLLQEWNKALEANKKHGLD